ncbi:hypothetical protein Glove_79g90 [Diversispora epigaea]|uniref:Uncharacterized protein n=1 Tax=Diversispora epigaea TaxID=1348612 RepID=A0A397JHA1_9GLOM|nr:hypothetical protein Glove_79g90 [Diversispora epigaea]
MDICNATSLKNQSGDLFNDMNTLNTVSNTWTSFSISENVAINTSQMIKLFYTNTYEWSQMNATGVEMVFFFSPDGYIIIFGGCLYSNTGVYVSASPYLDTLDTNKAPFEWSIPSNSEVNSLPSIRRHTELKQIKFLFLKCILTIWVTTFSLPDNKTTTTTSSTTLSTNSRTSLRILNLCTLQMELFSARSKQKADEINDKNKKTLFKLLPNPIVDPKKKNMRGQAEKADQEGRNIKDIASEICDEYVKCKKQNICRKHHVIPTPSIIYKRITLACHVFNTIYRLRLLIEEKSKLVIPKQRFWTERLVDCHFRYKSPQSSCPEITHTVITKLPKHTYDGFVEFSNKVWLDKDFDPSDFAKMLRCIFVLLQLQYRLGIDKFNWETSHHSYDFMPENSEQVKIVKPEAFGDLTSLIEFSMFLILAFRPGHCINKYNKMDYTNEITKLFLQPAQRTLHRELWSSTTGEKCPDFLGITKISYNSIEEFRSSLQKIIISFQSAKPANSNKQNFASIFDNGDDDDDRDDDGDDDGNNDSGCNRDDDGDDGDCDDDDDKQIALLHI